MKNAFHIVCDDQATPRLLEFLRHQTGKPDDSYSYVHIKGNRPPRQFAAIYTPRRDGDFDFVIALDVATCSLYDENEPFIKHITNIIEGYDEEEVLILRANRLEDFPDVFTGRRDQAETFNEATV